MNLLFLSSEVIREKLHFSKLLFFFTLTRPAGVKILPKEVNPARVPMDSERPKDLFSFCLAALSQLEAKWHGGAPMCVLCRMEK